MNRLTEKISIYQDIQNTLKHSTHNFHEFLNFLSVECTIYYHENREREVYRNALITFKPLSVALNSFPHFAKEFTEIN